MHAAMLTEYDSKVYVVSGAGVANPTTNPLYTDVVGLAVSPDCRAVVNAMSNERKSELATFLNDAILRGTTMPSTEVVTEAAKPLSIIDKARLICEHSEDIKVRANELRDQGNADLLLAYLKAGLTQRMADPRAGGLACHESRVIELLVDSDLRELAYLVFKSVWSKKNAQTVVNTSFKQWVEQDPGLEWISDAQGSVRIRHSGSTRGNGGKNA